MSKDPLIGQRLANYQIENVLGRGGMAMVYYARDVSLQRPVAVKVIDTQFRQNVSYAQRFISEARSVATWRHENIVQVFYADQEDDLYYFVMEYIDGLDLESLLFQYAEEGELMPQDDVIRIGKAVASALDYAHTKGVIHRDIKPSNVMIASDDRVVLMDFGLALDTQQGSMGEVFGTPHYVSPEQARRSADAIPQSDVYSLGVMLFEMLTGVVPFDDPSPTALALQHLTLPPPSPRSLNPKLNQATEDVLLKAMAKQSDERYQNATTLLDALEQAIAKPADKLATAELPPLPPGMSAPKRSVSRHTVTERVAVHVQATKTQLTPNPPRVRETEKQRPELQTKPPAQPMSAQGRVAPTTPETSTKEAKPQQSIIVPIIIIFILGIIVVGGGGLYFSGFFNQELPELPTEIVMNTSEAQAVSNDVTESATSIPTNTSQPATQTSVPTTTDIPATNTPLPTSTVVNTNTPLPTNTIAVTNTPLIVEPTVLYPNGRPIQFFWDNNSFYWYNPTGERLRGSLIQFEALTSNGGNGGYVFEGWRWSNFSSSLFANACYGIEITASSPLRPSECREYNALVTPQRDTELTFWLDHDTVIGFRVLWNDEEVGRCDSIQGFCEVRIP